eukprot:Gregarina_sp_Poly_1__3720@NODE_20_length_21312_cov_69_583714_g18_i0_p3_GENE_NODE_20_length_21312_cov_69_583714_g18_i0NODE_20_length_21312_cov_69_583714_g18_i0_p3_ORF_typecomplete_len633_score74_73C2C2_1/PF11618_8/0_19PRY/PF13765_6/79PRY/PF13765_6/2e02PRY/PF13765_6/1_5PRY/PF13765_6/3_3e02_NODE_20_length_21312_cov_69_583714_g18_i046906588
MMNPRHHVFAEEDYNKMPPGMKVVQRESNEECRAPEGFECNTLESPTLLPSSDTSVFNIPSPPPQTSPPSQTSLASQTPPTPEASLVKVGSFRPFTGQSQGPQRGKTIDTDVTGEFSEEEHEFVDASGAKHIVRRSRRLQVETEVVPKPIVTKEVFFGAQPASVQANARIHTNPTSYPAPVSVQHCPPVVCVPYPAFPAAPSCACQCRNPEMRHNRKDHSPAEFHEMGHHQNHNNHSPAEVLPQVLLRGGSEESQDNPRLRRKYDYRQSRNDHPDAGSGSPQVVLRGGSEENQNGRRVHRKYDCRQSRNNHPDAGSGSLQVLLRGGSEESQNGRRVHRKYDCRQSRNDHPDAGSGSPQVLLRGGSEESQNGRRVRRKYDCRQSRNNDPTFHPCQVLLREGSDDSEADQVERRNKKTNHHTNQKHNPSFHSHKALFRGGSEEADGETTGVILEVYILRMSIDPRFTEEWPSSVFLRLNVGEYEGHTSISRVNPIRKRAKFGSVLGFPIVVDHLGLPWHSSDWLRLEVVDPRHSCREVLGQAELHLEGPMSRLGGRPRCNAGLLFKLPVHNEDGQQTGCVGLILKKGSSNTNKEHFIPDVESVALRGSTDLSSCSECRAFNEQKTSSRRNKFQS